MSNLSFNDLAALQLVLKYVSVKDLLISAMNGFADDDNVRAQDNADVCCKAVHSFLE